MNLRIHLSTKATASLSFHPHSGRYRLSVTVSGERPRTGGTEPDLFFYPEGGGVLALRSEIPITGAADGTPEWTASFGLVQTQVMLIVIYPMVRLRLDPWTGTAGVELDDPTVQSGLMIAARRVLGIH